MLAELPGSFHAFDGDVERNDAGGQLLHKAGFGVVERPAVVGFEMLAELFQACQDGDLVRHEFRPTVDVDDEVVPGRHGVLDAVPAGRDVGVRTVKDGDDRSPVETLPIGIPAREVARQDRLPGVVGPADEGDVIDVSRPVSARNERGKRMAVNQISESLFVTLGE